MLSLLRRSKNKKRRSENSTEQLENTIENLFALVQPRDIVGRGLAPADALEFYAPFLRKLDDAVLSVYGENFEITENREPMNIKYRLTKDGVNVVYSAMPIVGVGRSDPNSLPTIYNGILEIKETEIDFERAGRFLNAVLQVSLLAYRTDGNPTFQIFHGMGKSTISEGETLLEKLKVKPKEACEYLVYPGVVGWGYVHLGKSPSER